MARKQKAKWIGIDVGGANIKAASTSHPAVSLDFPLWKQPQLLAKTLKKLFREMGGCENIAVTMTGELADCFQTKREGVSFISKACADAAGDAKVHFYSVNGEFLTLAKACKKWDEVAASNWHALASWSARHAQQEGPGLVIDIGSTTTDIIPFAKRKVCCKAWNDIDRLVTGELVYTGVERSSVAGIAPELPLHGSLVPVMNELFATSLDAYLLLGEIPENEKNTATADGRGATKALAHARLARMVGGDSTTIARKETLQMASYIADRQAEFIATALRKIRSHHPQEIHFSGHGKFLARRALKLVSLSGPYESEYFGSDLGPRCAPAVALMELAQEYFQS